MTHRTLILVAIAATVGTVYGASILALDAASRPRAARPLPRKLVCVEVQDPGVGPYWTCAEKRP